MDQRGELQKLCKVGVHANADGHGGGQAVGGVDLAHRVQQGELGLLQGGQVLLLEDKEVAIPVIAQHQTVGGLCPQLDLLVNGTAQGGAGVVVQAAAQVVVIVDGQNGHHRAGAVVQILERQILGDVQPVGGGDDAGAGAAALRPGHMAAFKKNKEKMGDEKVLENVTFPDWVAYFKNSSYVVTDSCHGMSFAILYEKPFAGIGNEARGMVRSESLVKLFHLEDRLVKNSKNIINNGTLLKDIDYASVNEILESERERSRKWLEHAMFSEKVVKTYQAYPVRVEADQEKELVVTKEEIEQVKPTFWRGLLYRLPIGMQKKAKKMAKNYVTQKEEKNV